MEFPLSSYSYKGTIAEAISEAKLQKKLFVVYISDDDPESKHLENISWIDPTVTETLLKYCIFLHVVEGSSEARSFSKIYPQQSVPCITAVGYHGMQLWQHEGFVTADVLASSLEKAWLSLHFQETTAAFLTAALASGKQFAVETLTPPSLSGQVTQVQHSSTSNHAQTTHSETIEDANSSKEAYEVTYSKHETLPSPQSSPSDVPDDVNIADLVSPDVASSVRPQHLGISDEISEENTKCATGLARGNMKDSVEVRNEVSEMITGAAITNTEDTAESERSDDTNSTATKSTIIFLNIRLPDGSCLQAQFSVDDTLRTVKDYIKKNRASSDSFRLAIPYPRKIFNDHDLDTTLSELGFFNRQALIVVPQNNTNLHSGGGSSQAQSYSTNDTDDSPHASEGYWASLRKILSYVNPLSYIPRNSSSQNDPQRSQDEGMWQYRSNPSSQYTRGNETTPSPNTSTESSRNSNRRRQPSGFVANIHTLKQGEDDERFNDRNAFWNGNSTQFGGNDDGK